jgi:desulfoferrodoxin (superoxide reductase-like protein)
MKTAKPGTLHAMALCNIHGLWQNSAELKLD